MKQILVLIAGVGVFVVLIVVFFLALFPRDQARPSDSLLYSLEGLDAVPESSILYGEDAGVDVGLEGLSAIALLPDGGFVVAGETGLRIYDRAYIPVAQTSLPEKVFALAAAGNPLRVYAGFRDHVAVYDAAGKAVDEWTPLGEQAQIVSLATDGKTVYVADSGNKTIACFDTQGRLLKFIGRPAAQDSLFLIPGFCFDIALDATGALWAVDPGRLRVVRLDVSSGAIDKFWGKASPLLDGFSGCCNPVNIAIAPDGAFVVQEKGIVRVKLYDKAGVFLGVVAGPKSFLEAVWLLDLAVASDGRVFLADPSLKKVRIFSKKGQG